MWRHCLFHLLIWSFGFLQMSLARLEAANNTVLNPLSSKIGEVARILYVLDERKRPDEDDLCFLNRYNCTTPRGPCSSDQLADVGDPYFSEGVYVWFCAIEIHQMSLDDVGLYRLCKLPADGQSCVDNHGQIVNVAAWERDDHGRICQTSFDKNSEELVNNCSKLTTLQPTTTQSPTTQPQTTEATETTPPTPRLGDDNLVSINITESGRNDHYVNEERDLGKYYSLQDIILTAVGVFISTLALVAVIWAIHRNLKRRRKGREFEDNEGYISGLPMQSPQHVASNGGPVHHHCDTDDEVEKPA